MSAKNLNWPSYQIEISPGNLVKMPTKCLKMTNPPHFCVSEGPWADWNLAEGAEQVGNMLKHANQSQHNPDLSRWDSLYKICIISHD